MERQYSEYGIPILPKKEKLEALAVCMNNGSYEDAAGHLCDLLEYCRRKITHNGMMFANLDAMVKKYGKFLAPIEEEE
jgi:hypothetical protein